MMKKRNTKNIIDRQTIVSAVVLLVFVCLLIAAIIYNRVNRNTNQGSNDIPKDIYVTAGAEAPSSDSGTENKPTTEVKEVTPGTPFEETFFAMDTFMSVKCYGEKGEKAAASARKEIERLSDVLTAVEDDELMVAGRPESIIQTLNKNGSVTATEELRIMLEMALKVSERTGGLYDISIQPLMELWGFTNGNYHVPSEKEIEECLKRIDYTKIKLDASGTASIGEGQKIGLGSIAKGYASNMATDLIRKAGVDAAILSLGGNIQTLNKKVNGSLWKVGIKDPNASDSNLIAVLSIENKAVITSGTYERFFVDEATGKKYHHIVNPKTGYPAENGMLSVTIVSENGTLADTLSTACFVMGYEGAVDYWKQYGKDAGEEFEMVLITDDAFYATEGLEGTIDTDEKINWIKR